MKIDIRKQREKKSITQTELSKASGVGRITISRLESGKQTDASVSTLLSIAKALECSVSDLFCDAK